MFMLVLPLSSTKGPGGGVMEIFFNASLFCVSHFRSPANEAAL
jgi:hypothetical protein